MYFALGNMVRAEQELVFALHRGTDPRQVIPMLLKVCVHESRLIAALACARAELRRCPRDGTLRYLVAALYVALGRDEDARQELEILLRHDPEHAVSHYLLGVLTSPADMGAARAHFSSFLELYPANLESSQLQALMHDLRLRIEVEHETPLGR